MNSASVDLIYLDPPFNSKANYAAPIGSEAAGAEFKDTWTLQDVDITWLDLIEQKHPRVNRVIRAAMTDSDKSYLIYMAARLIEMHRLLKPTGSIYLHCDPTMSHSLKLLMDAIFGRNQFRNDIVWCYTGSNSPTKDRFNAKSDNILFYAGEGAIFNKQYVPYGEKTLKQYNKVDASGRRYRKHSIRKDGTEHRLYLDEARGIPVLNWWTDIKSFGTATQSKERTGYPTQKPLALLRRIIRASSDPDQIVLDPFCGCATACIAAEIETRQWVGIDISPKASDLVRMRMQKEVRLFYQGTVRDDIPRRTDIGTIPRYNSPENRDKLYGMQGGYCAACETHFEPRNLEVDHIIARSQGGTDHIENLQLLCGSCNRIKGNRGMEYLLSKLAA